MQRRKVKSGALSLHTEWGGGGSQNSLPSIDGRCGLDTVVLRLLYVLEYDGC